MKKRPIIAYFIILSFQLCFASTPADTIKINIYSWSIQEYNLETYPVAIDTTLDNFQVYKPLYKDCPFNSFLGNLGTAYQPNLYHERKNNNDFIFLYPYYKYLYLPGSRSYFNTTTPYTHIMYTTSAGSKEQKEEMISLFHTQNINPDLNLGFSYDRISSYGLYLNQKAVTSAFGLFSSFRNHDYFFNLTANINSVKHAENGGLVDVDRFMDATDDPSTYATRLTDANILIKNKNAYLVHGYTFSLFKTKKMVDSTLIEDVKLQGTLLHTFSIEQSYRTFRDVLNPKQPSSIDTTGDWIYYYPILPINEVETYDSIYFRMIGNYLQYQMEPGENSWLHSGLRIGAGNELVKYASCSQDTSTMIEGQGDSPVNSYISSELYNTSGLNWNWSVYGRYYFTGYKTNNTEISARLGKHLKLGSDNGFVSIGWINKTTKPNYFYNYYYSNHLRWENNFSNIIETNIGASISIDSRQLELEGRYSLIDNFIYQELVDSTTFSNQYSNPLSIISVALSKSFQFWKLYAYNKVAYQIVDNPDILSLPELSVFNSTYFQQTIVRNVLDARMGFDITYNTAYYANAFMASHGTFYNQNYRKLGNYPYIDVYISAKLKRTKFLIKFNHVNEGLLPREYFTTYNYPMDYRRFVFGISWMFYD